MDKSKAGYRFFYTVVLLILAFLISNFVYWPGLQVIIPIFGEGINGDSLPIGVTIMSSISDYIVMLVVSLAFTLLFNFVLTKSKRDLGAKNKRAEIILICLGFIALFALQFVEINIDPFQLVDSNIQLMHFRDFVIFICMPFLWEKALRIV